MRDASSFLTRVRAAFCLLASAHRILRSARGHCLSTRPQSNPVALGGEGPDTTIPVARIEHHRRVRESAWKSPSRAAGPAAAFLGSADRASLAEDRTASALLSPLCLLA